MAERLVTSEEMRLVDREAMGRFGIPEIALMENAGAAIARMALERLDRSHGRVVVACGPGNNGGDGLVAMRHLFQSGVNACGILLKNSLSHAAGVNLDIARRIGLCLMNWPTGEEILEGLSSGDVVVDAVFGTGLSRPPEGEALRMLEAVSRAASRGAAVISADVPSGLSDRGPLPGCVRATATAALGFRKVALATGAGPEYAGSVSVVDISIPTQALDVLEGPRTMLLRESDGPLLIPERRLGFHKGEAGHVAVVMGGEGKSGAGVLACLGALACGAGLVTAVGRPGVLGQVHGAHPALMGLAIEGKGAYGFADRDAVLRGIEGKDVLVIGPGLERGAETEGFLLTLLEAVRCKSVVLDADALNAIVGSSRLEAALAHSASPLVLTPHPGEMARLAKSTVAEVQADRVGIARRYAKEHRVTLVLKGNGSVVATPDGEASVVEAGCPGMATAGAGDVLSGCVAALAAQCASVEEGTKAAVLAHGLAGQLAAEQRGMLGLTAAHLVDGLSLVWRRWAR